MKANPVYDALEGLHRFELKLINTDQHYGRNMSKLFFEELGMKKPHVELKVGSASHALQTAKILERYEKVQIDSISNLVVVFGDVDSTVACSLASVKLQIPIAHVEAGLRSYDSICSASDESGQFGCDFCDQTEFLNPSAVNNLIYEGNGHQIWYLLNFTLWWKEYMHEKQA